MSGAGKTPASSKMTKSKPAKAGAKRSAQKKAPGNSANDPGPETDAVALLKSDHRRVEKLFESYERADEQSLKLSVVREICRALIIHTRLEEEIFYPACREKIDDVPLDDAQVEHDGAAVLIGELLEGSPDDPFFDAKVRVLAEMIRHHVQEEEKQTGGIFARAKSAGVNTAEIAQRLTARRSELLQGSDHSNLERPRPRSFTTVKERTMPQGNYRDRDDRGRYMSGNDDDNRSGSGRRGRDYDDNRGRQPRDEDGRFMSGDDGRDYDYRTSRGRGRDEDYGSGYQSRDSRGRFVGDDDGYGRQSGRGPYQDDDGRGWYGEPERHARAARRGWDQREDYSGGGRQSRDYRNDDTRDYGDRDYRSGRGWYGEPDRHARASRQGWEDREDRGGRGRSEGQYASGDYGQRFRDDDEEDDYRTGRRSGRSHGGWYGDSEGHARAARRGWQDR